MDRPYIICHMLSSVDGKINGPYMDTPEAGYGCEEFESINTSFHCQAWMNGRVTVEENMTFGCKPQIEKKPAIFPREDYVANAQAEMYMIAADPSGKLGWAQNYVEYADRPKAHIIEVLTNKVSDAYLSYLRKLKISYIFAGDTEIDCRKAVWKLKYLFGIERLKLGGGGILNWSFLQAGLVDELSIVIAPVTDGDSHTPTLFEKAEFPVQKATVSFTLKEAKPLENGCVWVHYMVNND